MIVLVTGELRGQESKAPATQGSRAPLLEARGLNKRFGHILALRGADFSAYPGEVVALVGDNGAGKSTLVKCLCGALRPDSGEVLLRGKPVSFSSPLEAQRAGIETVYQDLALAPDLNAAANVYLGRELKRPGFLGHLGVLNKEAMQQEAILAFGRLGIRLEDETAPIARLSGGQQQIIAVARAVAWASSVVFLDEPTAALGVVQREKVLNVIRAVRDAGVSVILISHNMPDVFAVADRIEVLRLGVNVASFDTQNASLEGLVAAMTGATAMTGMTGATAKTGATSNGQESQ